jgi:guanylate kinase
VSSDARERGELIVIAAPSGAGKTTLVHALLERIPNLKFSISHTTRKPRSSEKHGVDYFFVDDAEFGRMADAGEFLEHALVFDHWYGTGKAYVEQLRAQGRTVVLEIDWQGAQQVRREAPDAKTIFILPPSVAELERRLRGRGTDSEATITRRLRDSVSDMRHWDEFDYIIVNDDVTAAAEALAGVVAGRGESYSVDAPAIRSLVTDILAGHGRLQ